MKKTFTILIAALMLLTMISQPTRLWGQERGTSNYTITFKTASNDNPSAYTTSTTCSSIVSGGSDYLTGNLVTATKVYGPGTYGLKMGTSSQGGVIKMNLSTAGQAYVISVVVRAKRYNSGTAATIAVNGETAKSTTSSFADYTFTINDDITYLQLNASKYLWVESIVVNYTTYTVTYNANDANATGSTVDSDSPYKKGASVTVMDCGFEVAGKTFDGWYTNSSYTGTKYVSGDTYTNSISDDVTFYAKWTSSSPTLSVEPEEAETFTYSHGDGPSEEQMFQVTLVNSSNDITVSVESDDDVFEITDDVEYGVSDLTISSGDYFAVRLAEGLDIGSYSGTITITSAGATPIEIELSGTVTGYTVTYKHGNGGTGDDYVDNNGGSGYEYHTDVTVLGNGSGDDEPNFSKTGYSFARWDTAENGPGAPYNPTEQIENIEDNVTLYAQWTRNSYGYTLTKTGEIEHATAQLKNGDDVIGGSDEIPYDTEVTIDVTPDDGYAYTVSVKDSGNNDVTVTNNKFNMPASAVTVTVNISESYNITVGSPAHGSVSVDGSVTSAAPGTTISLTATPSSGYNLAAWNVYKTGDESTTVTVTNNQFTMPSHNVTVSATFDQCVVLPYSWAGGVSSALNAVVGVTVSGAGTDYGNDHNPCNIKFDGTGDYILIKTNSRPGKVTVKVKMVGGSTTSTITIQESSNGSSFSDVADLTISGDQNDVLDLYTTNEFASTSRYVKFLFTKGSNVGVGPITIAKYSTDPEINADDTDIACDALSGSIEFTITRPVVDGVLTAEITDGNEGSWLSLTPGTYTTEVPFTCSANATDSDRSAIVTLTYTYNTSETVTKEVTVTQGKRDYAMLTSDFTYDEGGTGVLPIGLTESGLGSAYSSSPKMKFDNTGDYLELKLGEAPVQISYKIKGNTFLGGTFKVQLSADGSSYEDLATHTTIDNSDAKTYTHICNNSSVKYIRWIYTNKSSGNVGLGNIKVSKTATNSSTLSGTNTITVGRGSTLTFSGNCSDASWLVIEEGGQLILSGGSKDGVQATFQREVEGYGSSTGKDKYILLANPTTGSINPEDVDGMLDDNYDLYYFDEAQTGAEWRNYKQGVFSLENGKGYLYANSSNITLNLAGAVPTGTSSSVTLNKKGDGTYAGFNLVGNPMSVNITSMNIGGSGCSYYKLHSSTGVFEASDAPIIVGEAFMVEAPSNGATLSLNPGSKDESGFNNDVIRLEVSNNKYKDVAFLYFGNHLPLTKINHLNDEAPMIYIHNESANQAVAVMNERSEVKTVNVNFEAKTMGSYTISAKAEKGNFSYMHLYDRLTGIDTDLLISDYTFIGSTTDSKDRFILRFEAVDTDTENEIFAYQSGNNIYVSGEGELQIFDVTGRFVMSERINGATSINADALSKGVYVLRIIGSEIKTQKIVVR